MIIILTSMPRSCSTFIYKICLRVIEKFSNKQLINLRHTTNLYTCLSQIINCPHDTIYLIRSHIDIDHSMVPKTHKIWIHNTRNHKDCFESFLQLQTHNPFLFDNYDISNNKDDLIRYYQHFDKIYREQCDLIVTYEEIKEDKLSSVRRLVNFLTTQHVMENDIEGLEHVVASVDQEKNWLKNHFTWTV